MPAMYILRCSDGSFYVGSTRDLSARFEQHQWGFGGNYTSKRLPVELAYAEEYERIDDAYYREKQVQGWGRAKRIALIEGRYKDLPELSRTARPAAAEQAISADESAPADEPGPDESTSAD